MTGDRMINLAKTPANIDFQSKYYKPHSGAAVKSLDAKFSGAEDPEAGGSAPNSPSESSSHLEKNASSQRQNVSIYTHYLYLNLFIVEQLH